LCKSNKAISQWGTNNNELIVGYDTKVPVITGIQKPYINFDNASTTPALLSVKNTVDEILVWYSSVNRGTGYKSRLTTRLYELARRQVMSFVGADHDLMFAFSAKTRLRH
jgi:cysteine desulfurase / selenocysteine lyase